MSNITYSLLTNEQVVAIGLPATGVFVAVAQNESGEIVSMTSFNIARRGTMCDNCTQHCATGGIVWTRSDYRGQGIFQSLWYWARGELGFDRVYVHNPSPAGRLIATIGTDVFIPKNIDEFPPVENLKISEAEAEALASTAEGVL